MRSGCETPPYRPRLRKPFRERAPLPRLQELAEGEGDRCRAELAL
jgi:hypothetical protein